ncbi:hypothetical protein [Pseudomonas sp. LFM046]|uniref:hypothetical protein n=1 Tax=Pseudomonas sp. LFM046 TaxID=1608357 RepID=UPI0006969478|nr:hypothetical protein [Pseudomonas sp. LFM046]
MLEKLSHIKNPLSVIAIFAGLAEVSGTGVLPLLERDIQHIYVWFLMGFPCLLVGLFFITLWKNHVVLYAPSDFSNDQIFADILVSGTISAKYEKLQREIQSEATTPSEQDQATSMGSVEPETTTTPAVLRPESPSLGNEAIPTQDREVVDFDNPEHIQQSPQLTPANSKSLEIALAAEELAIDRLGQSLGVIFNRNTSIKGLSSTVYDGAFISKDQSIVVEVKYTRTGMYAKDNIRHSFNHARLFWEHLPSKMRTKFEFKFIIVHAQAAEPDRIARMEKAIRAISAEFSFKTDVITYDYEKLKNEAQPPA